jgi:hypothetical protein
MRMEVLGGLARRRYSPDDNASTGFLRLTSCKARDRTPPSDQVLANADQPAQSAAHLPTAERRIVKKRKALVAAVVLFYLISAIGAFTTKFNSILTHSAEIYTIGRVNLSVTPLRSHIP